MSDAPATLGIDPGLGCTGFAVLDPQGRLFEPAEVSSAVQEEMSFDEN